MDSNMREVIVNVKNLLFDKSNWTQGADARDKDGYMVSTDSPKATQFCLAGAICKFDEPNFWIIRQKLLSFTKGSDSMVYINDFLGYDAVMSLLTKATKEE